MKPRRQIAFLSGRGDPERWTLSPALRRFLVAVRSEDDAVVTGNFPNGETGEHRAVPLLAASWRNLRKYVAPRWLEFAREYRPAIAGLLVRAQRTWFVAGSCGLELFNNLELGEAWERRCTLICLGPVARRRPRWAECVVAQGTQAVVSRVFVPRRDAVYRVRCGHLGYLTEPGARLICRDRLNQSSPCANIFA